VLDDFDAFMQTVSVKLSGYQLLEQENNELKTELETAMKTIDSLRKYLDRKESDNKIQQQDRLRMSQELTQFSYDSGKIIQITEQSARLKYDLDVANTTINSLRRELTLIKTENERYRRNSHSSSSSFQSGNKRSQWRA